MESATRILLQAIWDLTAEVEAWPNLRKVDRHLWRVHSLEAAELITAAGSTLVRGGQRMGGARPDPNGEVGLTVLGLAACSGTEAVLDTVLRAVHAAVIADRSASGDADPELTADAVIKGASDGNARRADSSATSKLTRLTGLVLANEPWRNQMSLYEEGWKLTIDTRIRDYRNVRSLDDYLGLRADEMVSMLPAPSVLAGSAQVASPNMKPERALQELRRLRAEADVAEVRRSGPAHKAWKAKVDAVLSGALGEDSRTLQEFRAVRYSVGVWGGAPGEAEQDARYFAERVGDATALVDAAVYELELQTPDTEEVARPVLDPQGPIFIVHGRDDTRRHELARILERTTGRTAIVLHEQASGGATVIEKLERHAQKACFAVVLLTGDDIGGLNGQDVAQRPRARQNVIFELGLFIGLLGRNHVAILLDEGVEKPSDLEGLVYIALDERGAWHMPLMKELQEAGVPVDRNKLP